MVCSALVGSLWLLPLLCLSFSSDGLTFSSDRKMLIFPLTLTGILRPYFTCLHGMQLCGVFPSCLIPPALQLKKIRSSLGFLKAYLTLRSCFCACPGCIHSPTPQYSGSGTASLGETQPQGWMCLGRGCWFGTQLPWASN